MPVFVIACIIAHRNYLFKRLLLRVIRQDFDFKLLFNFDIHPLRQYPDKSRELFDFLTQRLYIRR